MDAPHHMAAILEVDLSACHHNTLVDRINAVPALKTSAAFFSFLRANLVLPHSEMPSNVNTPVMGPKGGSSVAKPAKARTCAAAAPSYDEVSLDDIPPLTLGVLTEHEDKVDALQLVADSVAQQRQTASRSLVFHPLDLAVLGATLYGAYLFSPRKDLGSMMTIFSGLTMSYLGCIRYFGSQYLQMAEEINWDWLKPKTPSGETSGEDDILIGARYGEEMIGALVLRLEAPASADEESSAATGASTGAVPASTVASRKKTTRAGAASQYMGGHGVVRAWTTRLRYRRRGIGGDLLQEAVRVTRERCGADAAVSIAEDHVNSKMILYDMYNGPFHKAEQIAVKTLAKTLAAQQ